VANRAGERAFMTHWLASSLTGGDQIVADLRAITGPGLRWDLLIQPVLGIAAVIGAVSAWRDLVSGPGSESHLALAATMIPLLAGTGWSAVTALTRRPVYVAVTERQIIVVQMRSRRKPVRVLVAAPIGGLHLTATSRLGRRSLTVTDADGRVLPLAGRGRGALRMSAIGRRPRFDDAIAAAVARGGLVNLPVIPAAIELTTAGTPDRPLP
jgi:hypothetical protein